MSTQPVERSFEETYTRTSKELHFSIDSPSSQIASHPLKKTMGAYISYRVAIDRLDAAVVSSGTTGYAGLLSDAAKNAIKLRQKIVEQIKISQETL